MRPNRPIRARWSEPGGTRAPLHVRNAYSGIEATRACLTAGAGGLRSHGALHQEQDRCENSPPSNASRSLSCPQYQGKPKQAWNFIAASLSNRILLTSSSFMK